MPITISIHGENAQQAIQELLTLALPILGGRAQPVGTGAPSTAETVAQTKINAASAPVVEDTVEKAAPEAPKTPKTRAKKETAPKAAPAAEAADTQAQDQLDEEAESEADAGTTLTHDDVRQALGKYVKKYGLEFAQEDGPKVLGLMFGEGVKSVSKIPDTQEALAKAVAGVDEMLVKNPFKRAVADTVLA
jgi:hypothetical protein